MNAKKIMSDRIRGVLAPVLTPFDARLQPDGARFISHCRWLIDNQVGLAVFGTNSEAASITTAERIALTEALLDAGIPASKLMPGTGACALPDAVELSRHASKAGVAGLLILPPYFFKGVTEDGVFAYYSEIIERVGTGCAPIYLYHIPQLSGVPITFTLIERLRKRYPSVIAGAKDSSGDWTNIKAMIDNFASDGFDVFPASESFLSAAMPIGAAGCISATVNINPTGIYQLFQRWDSVGAKELQLEVDLVRNVFQGSFMIPAMKYAIANCSGDASWRNVRPPLAMLDEKKGNEVIGALDAIRFSMQNYSTRAAFGQEINAQKGG